MFEPNSSQKTYIRELTLCYLATPHVMRSPYLAPSAARGPSKATMLADEVGVDVLPGGHDVALGAVTAPTPLFLSARARGGRKGGAASPPGLRLHVTPEVSYPGLGKVVPVIKSAGG